MSGVSDQEPEQPAKAPSRAADGSQVSGAASAGASGAAGAGPSGAASAGPSGAAGAGASGGTGAGRGVLYIAFAKFYFMIAGLVIQVRLPAVLSRAAFGSYSLVANIASLVNNVLVTGTIQAVSRFAAQEPGKARRVQQAGLRMHVRLGLVDRRRLHRRRAADRVAAPRHDQDRAADARGPDRRRLFVLRGVHRDRERPAPVPQAGRARHDVRHAARRRPARHGDGGVRRDRRDRRLGRRGRRDPVRRDRVGRAAGQAGQDRAQRPAAGQAR